MNNKKIERVKKILNYFLIVYIGIIALIFYASGYIRDEYNISSDNSVEPTRVLLIIAVVSCCFVIMMNIAYRKKQRLSVFLGIVISVLLIAGGVNVFKSINYYYGIMNESKKTSLKSISLEELEKIISEKNMRIIYVGRDTCPNCKVSAQFLGR